MSVCIDKKSVLSSFTWKLLERILAQGINFIIQLVLARLLMPEDFASLAIIVAITNYAAIFVQNGLSATLIQKEGLDKVDISTMLTCSLVVAAIMYILIFFLSPFLSSYYGIPELKWALRVQALILFLYALNSIQLAVLQRDMKFKEVFIRSIIAIPVAGAIGIVLAYIGCGVWALVAFNLLNVFILIFVIIIKGNAKLKFGFSLDRAKKLYKFSSKLILAGLVSGLYDSVRTIVIGKKYTKDQLAYYDKAYTYSYYVVSIFGNSLSSVLLPVLSRQQNDTQVLKFTAKRSICLSTYIMFPLLFGVIATARPLVIVLLSSKWEFCVPYLIAFCVLRLPECMITIDKQAYYAVGNSEICLKYEIMLCIMNMTALLLTINHGVMTIAVGAVIVELIAGIVIGIISQKIYGYKLTERLKDNAKPLINSIIMFGVVYPIQNLNIHEFFKLIIGGTAGVVVYFVLSLITKDNNLIEIKSFLLSMFRKGDKK